jgi:transcription termination factor Rho
MAVLDRSELQASSLADLHAIADQLGLEGFRRLRKNDLIDAILGGRASERAESAAPGGVEPGASGGAPAAASVEPVAGEGAGAADGSAAGIGGVEGAAAREERASARGEESRRPASRIRRLRRARFRGEAGREPAPSQAEVARAADAETEGEGAEETSRERQILGEPARRGEQPAAGRSEQPRARRGEEQSARRGEEPRARRGEAQSARRGEAQSARRGEEPPAGDRLAEGVVELLGNGSAFLRVNPPEASDADVYISAAQVRRCELVSGDRVSGPVRMPRRSERYPSLVRVETINGTPAGEVSAGGRYEDRPVAYPSERLALEGGDATLHAIEWLTPFGRGSRVLIAGPARSGKTEILRRLLGALHARADLEVSLVLAGVRPEEITEWSEGPVAPAAALSFAASADAQGRAVERAIETATRSAARGADALVLIDTLEGLHPHAARKALAAARNLRDGGSLTVIATAARAFGGETTVIALDPALAGAGGPPLDLIESGTVRAELLVGEEGAAAIARARAEAIAR